jgi:hypothetical protein
MSRRLVLATIAVVGGGLFLGLLALGEWIWIPDLIFPAERQTARLDLANGEYIELSEKWNGGDGYLLKLKHHLAGKRVASIILDGDSMKAWNSQIKQHDGNFAITVRGKKLGLYDASTYSCQVGKHSMSAYVDPE